MGKRRGDGIGKRGGMGWERGGVHQNEDKPSKRIRKVNQINE